MSDKENQSNESDNYSEKAVFITIKDDASSPSVLIDQYLDNDFSSSSSNSPKKSLQ